MKVHRQAAVRKLLYKGSEGNFESEVFEGARVKAMRWDISIFAAVAIHPYDGFTAAKGSKG